MGDSRSGPKPVNLTSCPGKLGPVPKVPWVPPAAPGVLGLGPRARRVDQLSLATRLGPVREVPRSRPAVPDDSGPVLRARRINQLSRATRDRVQGAAVSITFPGGIEPGSEGPWGRTSVPGDSAPGPSACGVNQLNRTTRALVQGDRRVDLRSRVTHSHVQGPAVSIRCPGGLRPVSEDLW